MADDSGDNPYPGPRPFEKADRPYFFGRDAERGELVALVLAHRVVLLYAASGAGKTSLLNAGVAPVLEAEGLQILRGRIRLTAEQAPMAAASNAYTAAFLSSVAKQLGEEADSPSLATKSLAEGFEGHQHPVDLEGFALPRLLIFDQFEELFTLHGEFWKQRSAFVSQIVEALEKDPLLRIVLSIREDYVAELGSYASLFPDGFRIRFRLERLRKEPALEAITGPLRGTRRSFARGVAELLVSDLLEQRIELRLPPEPSREGRSFWERVRERLRFEGPARRAQLATIEGEFVEPVQLQTVCRTLWERLPDDVTQISEQAVRELVSVDQVLRRLYQDAVTVAARAGRIREAQLRARVAEAFITPGGTRGSAYRDVSTTAGIPNRAIDVLESERLLRAEERSGAVWYELTHDRLIAPIRASNDSYVDVRQRRLVGAALAAALVSAVIAVAVTIPLLTGNNKAVLDFGSVQVGSPFPTKTYILKSESQPLSVIAVVVTPRDFLSGGATPCTLPGTLPARRTCSILVTFAPSAAGRKRGTLRILGPNRTVLFEVTLTGTAA